MLKTRTTDSKSRWTSVGDIPNFPFEDFEQLQAATAIRSFNIGVDSLAAARWSQQFNSRINKVIIAALSLLLVAAAVASIVAALWTREYWLLAAAPVQALSFYLSNPASALKRWVTIAGAISIAAFIDLLLNGLPVAATLVAYAGLTFAAVRSAGYLTNSSFRRALIADENLFLAAYTNGACTIRNNRTKLVYSA